MNIKKRNKILRLLPPFIILTAILMAYIKTIPYPFQFDDKIAITQNPSIHSFSQPLQILRSYPPRFLTQYSFAFNYWIHGLNSSGFRIINIIIHLFTSLLIWMTTKNLLALKSGSKGVSKSSVDYISLLCGLIFAVHPLQTQSITYIVQRTTSLTGFFYICSLFFFIKFRTLNQNDNGKSKEKLFLAASICSGLAGMFCKEISVTLPIIIILVDLYFFEKRKILISLNPFKPRWRLYYMLMLLVIPIAMKFGESNFSEMMKEISAGTMDISRQAYLLTQLKVIPLYIFMFFVPYGQNIDHDMSISQSIFDLYSFAGLLIILTLLITAWHIKGNNPFVSFGILWTFITISVESSIIPLRNVMFEHRMYIPIYGLALITSVIASKVTIKRKRNCVRQILMAAICIILTYLSFARNSVWRTEFTLWNDSVRKSPGKARPYNNRGYAWFNLGQYQEALDDFDKALQLDSDFEDAYANRGALLLMAGKMDQAESDLKMSIKLNPDNADAYINLGNLYVKMKQFNQAEKSFEKAESISPYNSEIYNNRGIMHAVLGSYEKAMKNFNHALKIDAGNSKVYFNRGFLYLSREGERESVNRALNDLKKAVEINPDYGKAWAELGKIYFHTGQYYESYSAFVRAASLGINIPEDVISEALKRSEK